MKMTLCRTKDGRYLRAAGREAAPEGSEVIEPSKLSLSEPQAVVAALRGQRMVATEVLGGGRDGAAMVGL